MDHWIVGTTARVWLTVLCQLVCVCVRARVHCCVFCECALSVLCVRVMFASVCVCVTLPVRACVCVSVRRCMCCVYSKCMCVFVCGREFAHSCVCSCGDGFFCEFALRTNIGERKWMKSWSRRHTTKTFNFPGLTTMPMQYFATHTLCLCVCAYENLNCDS